MLLLSISIAIDRLTMTPRRPTTPHPTNSSLWTLMPPEDKPAVLQAITALVEEGEERARCVRMTYTSVRSMLTGCDWCVRFFFRGDLEQVKSHTIGPYRLNRRLDPPSTNPSPIPHSIPFY